MTKKFEKKVWIDLSKEGREHLAELFAVCDKTVYRALMFEGIDSDIKKKIRYVAVRELGGVRVNALAECETIHDADGYMRQYFGNGWLIEINKNTGMCAVYDKKGNVKIKQEHCTIEQLYGIQEIVEKAV